MSRSLIVGVIALAVLVPALAPPRAAPPPDGILLEVSAEGEVLSGSLDDLLEAVRAGRSLRVGWELPFRLPDEELLLEHWADAGFVSVWRGHVFAQLAPINAQGPVFDAPAIILQGEPHGWTGLIGTTGELRQSFSGEGSTQHVKTRWAVAH